MGSELAWDSAATERSTCGADIRYRDVLGGSMFADTAFDEVLVGSASAGSRLCEDLVDGNCKQMPRRRRCTSTKRWQEHLPNLTEEMLI